MLPEHLSGEVFCHVPQEEDSETLRPRTHWRDRVCRLILESLTVLAGKILRDNYTEMETGRLASLEKLFFFVLVTMHQPDHKVMA